MAVVLSSWGLGWLVTQWWTTDMFWKKSSTPVCNACVSCRSYWCKGSMSPLLPLNKEPVWNLRWEHCVWPTFLSENRTPQSCGSESAPLVLSLPGFPRSKVTHADCHSPSLSSKISGPHVKTLCAPVPQITGFLQSPHDDLVNHHWSNLQCSPCMGLATAWALAHTEWWIPQSHCTLEFSSFLHEAQRRRKNLGKLHHINWRTKAAPLRAWWTHSVTLIPGFCYFIIHI